MLGYKGLNNAEIKFEGPISQAFLENVIFYVTFKSHQ